MPTLLNIAHRGGAKLWPENTLYAFAEAARAGFNGAELDVQLTRDARLVVFHDFRLKRELCRGPNGRWLSGRQKPICELALAELSKLDVGRVNPRSLYARTHRVLYPRDGERIPLLTEVIATVRSLRRDFRLFIELKTSAADPSVSARPEAVAEAVIDELRSKHFAGDAILVGFDWRALIHAKKIAPELACWFTTKRRRPRSNTAWAGAFHPARFDGSIARAIAAAGGQGWFCSRAQVTRTRIAEAKALGLKLGVWTVNDTRTMRALRRLSIDALVTDRPDRLAKLNG